MLLLSGILNTISNFKWTMIGKRSERIQYIDALRGFTMILVVFAHVETFGFFNFGYETFVGRLFQAFRMPLFFFISGFIAYKKDRIWSRETCLQLAKKKALIQVIPALFFGLIYTYCSLHSDFSTFISDPSKLGYWFTFVLLEMFLIYYTLSGVSFAISRKIRWHETTVTVIVLVLSAIVCYLLKLPLKLIPLLDTIGNYTSLHYTFNYFIYFVFGVLFRQYFSFFLKLLDNKYFTAIVILLFAAIFFFSSDLLIHNNGGNIIIKVAITILETILGFLGILIVFTFFRKYSSSFESSTKLGGILQYIGKRTLDIYLLHYFFLARIPKIGDYLTMSNNVVIELSIGFILSIIIIGLCLCISNVIRVSPFLGKYLLGARE